MRRSIRLLPLAAIAFFPACSSLTSTADNSGYLYATLRGTVTRASGATVPNAGVGVSCVGTTNDPIGFTVDANASGAFELALNVPTVFPPLTGPSYVCRVLTPYAGVSQAEKSITVVVGGDRNARPVTNVSLVLP